MRRWENVMSDIEITLTDEMRDELGLFDDASTLQLRVKSSGYDDPGNPYDSNDNAISPEFDCEIHAIEGEVLTEDCDETPLSCEQINIILDDSKVLEVIYEKL